MHNELLRALNQSIANVLATEADDLLTLASAANLDPLTDFRGADLRGLDLGGENLRAFDLSEADLRGANLAWADLRGVNLSRANLRNANLANARMADAVLAGAVLDGANLTGTGVRKAPESRSRQASGRRSAKAPEPRQPSIVLPPSARTLPEMDETRHAILLGDNSTLDLVMAARAGDPASANALLERCLPALKRWARGRIPASLRRSVDEDDIVQEASLRVLRHLHAFEPRHVGAMQAYLRTTVINTIRDQFRHLARSTDQTSIEIDDSFPASPLETAIEDGNYELYRRALETLRASDRDLVVARVETQLSYSEIASRFSFGTPQAARVAVVRAVHRLAEVLSKAK